MSRSVVCTRGARAIGLLVSAAWLAVAVSAPLHGQRPGPPAAQPHVTYITPIWTSFISASEADVAAEVATLRSRIGEGGGAKLGFAVYLHALMGDWHVDITSPAAIRQALGPFEQELDQGLQRAKAHNVAFVVTLLTAIRSRTDAAQVTSYAEDRRVMQWVSTNGVATGWWTHSRYARRQYAVQRAYMQELARIFAERAALYPDTLVGIAGDGEVELAGSAQNFADYSPFAVAEFRDWLKAGGLYGPGGEFEAEAYRDASRYAGDATPAVDTNGDGHTLNGDLGTAFDTWDLRYFPWSLSDDPMADPNAIPASVYNAPEFRSLPVGRESAFDAPRTWDRSSAWCQLWNLFRQTMVWQHNKDVARWMTTAVDAQGRRLPADRWYSYQIPADYLFGSSPEFPLDRLLMSASPWWTANVAPYGGLGFTSFGVRFGRDLYRRTLPGLMGAIPSCGPAAPAPPQCVEGAGGLAGQRWGILEWNPVVSPTGGSSPARPLGPPPLASEDAGADAVWDAVGDALPPEPGDLTIYRDEMRLLRRHRPTILAPFYWNHLNYPVLGTGFETALREFTQLLSDGWAPPVHVSPSTLRMSVARSGQVVTSRSALQTVYVSQPSGGTVDWQATASKAWLAVGSASGHGDGGFTVDLATAGLAGLPAGQHGAVVTLVADGSIEGTVTVSVTLTITDDAPTSPPFGLIDTPLQNALGQVGAIGVTGWALDDVGVASVQVYRNCLAFEPPLNCGVVEGRQVVYIGDATFVSGARPDVEVLYPTVPQAYRGAWGYLLLTNLLPHVPLAQMFGGQGAITLFALATDVEGQQAWLGRAADDTTPTTVTLANDTIAVPFGSIDTPAQGQTVSGLFGNYGWVLTPDTDTTDGADDILMPTTGSPIWVWVDGVSYEPVTYYNLCRGTVGSPVPAGQFCDDDVSNIFGAPAPQAAFTSRTGNVTKFRNLDAGRGAIAAYLLDTTFLSNGVHTIVWSATDSAGRGEGIGSRFFTVLNAGADAAQARQGISFAEPMPLFRGDARDLEVWPRAPDSIRGRAGFDLNTPLDVVTVDDAGVAHVRVSVLGRIELMVGRGREGYLVANGTLRDLPIGSHLDAASGRFTWTPPPGYFGTYRLVFVGSDGAHVVDVAVAPKHVAESGVSEVRLRIDLPRSGATLGRQFVVAGWALDPQAAVGSGIGAVHVWAQPVELGRAPIFLGAAELAVARPDVAVAYGPQYGMAGFGLVSTPLKAGRYDVTAYVWNRRTARWEDARTVEITVR